MILVTNQCKYEFAAAQLIGLHSVAFGLQPKHLKLLASLGGSHIDALFVLFVAIRVIKKRTTPVAKNRTLTFVYVPVMLLERCIAAVLFFGNSNTFTVFCAIGARAHAPTLCVQVTGPSAIQFCINPYEPVGKKTRFLRAHSLEKYTNYRESEFGSVAK